MLRFLDRELDPTASVRVEEHLSACRSCRQVLGEWIRLYDQLESVPPPDVTVRGGFSRRLRNRIEEAPAFASPSPVSLLPAAAVTVGVLALVTWLGFHIGESSAPRRTDVMQSALSTPIDPDF